MRLHALIALLAVATATNAHKGHNRHRRQAPTSSSTTAALPTASGVAPPPGTSTPGSTSVVPGKPSSAPSAATGATSASTTSTPTTAAVPGATTPATAPNSPPPAGTDIPPLAGITFGMPTGSIYPVTTTYAAGATGPVSGAPPLPTPFVFQAGDWPAEDKIPDVNSPEVQEWLKELEGFNIPDLNPTKDGSCMNDTAAAADAQNRGWWTCGGWTRDTDITTCPDKYTWGLSFDDGPSPSTPKLLKFLTEKDIQATFFVVGSRVIERPNILIEEYMGGNEIAVHTWSHPHLTSLSNEQIVAELGWTRKAIKEVLGVSPTIMRPPFGDIDDRVRAISMAMGMVPMIWTRTPMGGQFDTNDWRVAGNLVTGTDSFASFEAILGNASIIDTGFIVLQHDLFEITVDLAVGYTLNSALSHNPPFKLMPIGECSKKPTSDLYLESNTNKTFPYSNSTTDVDGDGKVDSNASKSPSSSGASPLQVPILFLTGLAALAGFLL